MTANPNVPHLVCDALKSVHNHGAKLYNRGHHAEAYRLYQGALFVALQMLAMRPDLKFIIADGLSEVEQAAANDQLKAFRLHEVIEHVRTVLKVPVEVGSKPHMSLPAVSHS